MKKGPRSAVVSPSMVKICSHRNDSRNKVAEHCRETNVHFEYTSHWDREESIFHSAQNITALRIRFKNKIIMKGGKGQDEQEKVEEEC